MKTNHWPLSSNCKRSQSCRFQRHPETMKSRTPDSRLFRGGRALNREKSSRFGIRRRFSFHKTFAMTMTVCLLGVQATVLAQTMPESDWPAYGRDGGGSRYSPLAEI